MISQVHVHVHVHVAGMASGSCPSLSSGASHFAGGQWQPKITVQFPSKDTSPVLEPGPPVGGVACSPPVSTESVSSGHYSPPIPSNDMRSPSVKFSESLDRGLPLLVHVLVTD